MTSSAAHQIQTIVLGAGVMGLACARALSQTGREVLLLERHATFGCETSSRNSEVLHSSLYYPPGSLKARLCRSGHEQLLPYFQSRHIPHDSIGKLIVATNDSQWNHALPKLLDNARRCGTPALQLLTQDDVSTMEPELHCHGALYSPQTAIFDSHALMTSLLADAEVHHTIFVPHCEIRQLSYLTTNREYRYRLETLEGDEIVCQELINCTGLQAHILGNQLTRQLTPTLTATQYLTKRQYYAKGTYYWLCGQSNPFSHLIYPLPPNGNSLGIHVTLDLGGRVRFGPDVEWLELNQEASARDVQVDPTTEFMARKKKMFEESVRQYWPNLKDHVLDVDYVGVRAKCSHPLIHGFTWNDFQIYGPRHHGLPGLVHLLGMESPGLTSCMAVGDYVVGLLLTP